MSVGPDGGVPQRRRAASSPELTKRASKPPRKPDPLHFRVEFLSSSLGTEQELDGVIIKRHKNAGRKIGEVLRRGVTLLLITTDMVQYTDGDYHFCTLEIVTTPTEADDEVGWAYRNEAFSLLITEIESVAKLNGGKGTCLTSELLGVKTPYLMLICNPDHVISMKNPGSDIVITSTDRQGTVGVPIIDLDPVFHLTGSQPELEWYNLNVAKWAAEIWPAKPNVQIAYTMITSGILKCVSLMENNHAVFDAIWDADMATKVKASKEDAYFTLLEKGLQQGDTLLDQALLEYLGAEFAAEKALDDAVLAVAKLMASPAWKTSWKPMPRTPLIILVDQLPVLDAVDVLACVREFGASDDDAVLNWAKTHILAGFRVGGHDIEAPLIAGQRGFLLEYRGAQPNIFKDKFYYAPLEVGIYSAPVPPKVQREEAEKAAAVARKRRKSSL